MPSTVGLAACLLAGGGPLVALGTCLLALGPGETDGAPAVAMIQDDLAARAATTVDALGPCEDRRRSLEGAPQQGIAVGGRACEPGAAPAEHGASAPVR